MQPITSTKSRERVLGIHPTHKGFGWVIMDAPFSPLDWGIASAKVGRNARLIARFERITERYQPTVLVLESFDRPRRPRTPRTQDLCRTLIHLAAGKGMEIPVYDRHVVQEQFSHAGAKTRYEIAQFIGQQIDALSPRLPRRRQPWMPQDTRQALFDAVALAMTYYARTDRDDLSSA